MNCEFCDKTFSTKGNLTKHQKSAKHCIKIQKEKGNVLNDIKEFKCCYCNKTFTDKNNVTKHEFNCQVKFLKEIEKLNKIFLEKDEKISQLETEVIQLSEEIKIIELKTEKKILEKFNDHTRQKETQKYIQDLQNKIHEIAVLAIEQKNDKITNMIKKYVKKQPRKQFDCSNVIYILTTPSLKKDNRYIFGKAKNLTSRLSTYNKGDEHEVIFYQDCGDEDTMNTLEPMIFNKLKYFREQANIERFILPKDKNIDFFINIIQKCFEFLE